MSDPTHYTVLGVQETATQLEIKVAYRALLKKIHPDTVSSLSTDLKRMAEDVTKEIIEAYSVLSDASKRRQYDRRLAQYRQRSRPAPVAPTTPRPQPRNQRRDWDDLQSWAAKHPVLFLLIGMIILLFIISDLLTSDSSEDESCLPSQKIELTGASYVPLSPVVPHIDLGLIAKFTAPDRA